MDPMGTLLGKYKFSLTQNAHVLWTPTSICFKKTAGLSLDKIRVSTSAKTDICSFLMYTVYMYYIKVCIYIYSHHKRQTMLDFPRRGGAGGIAYVYIYINIYMYTYPNGAKGIDTGHYTKFMFFVGNHVFLFAFNKGQYVDLGFFCGCYHLLTAYKYGNYTPNQV